jgi:hypothetical protein
MTYKRNVWYSNGSLGCELSAAMGNAERFVVEISDDRFGDQEDISGIGILYSE